MNRKWIIEYTFWNAAFVYLNYPQIIGHQLAVLLAAAIVGLIRPERWLQARGYTLSTSLIALSTFPEVIPAWADTTYGSTGYRENLVSAVCIGIILVYTFRFFQLQFRKKHQSVDLQN